MFRGDISQIRKKLKSLFTCFGIDVFEQIINVRIYISSAPLITVICKSICRQQFLILTEYSIEEERCTLMSGNIAM